MLDVVRNLDSRTKEALALLAAASGVASKESDSLRPLPLPLTSSSSLVVTPLVTDGSVSFE